MKNKIFNLLLLAVMLLCGSGTLWADEALTSTAQSQQVRIEYETLDECNNTVTLSAILTIPDTAGIDKIVLSNTSRNTISNSVASRMMDGISVWSAAMCKNTVVVETGDVVSGTTQLRSVPVYAYNLAGRQSIDALRAAIDYLLKNGLITEGNYSSYIMGYGTGGNVALAAQRCLERDCTEEQQKAVSLKNTFYAFASDTPLELWKKAEQNDSNYSASQVMAMLRDMLATYREGCLKTYTQEDIFSKKLLNSSVLHLLKSPIYSEEDISELLLQTFGTRNPALNQILSEKMIRKDTPVHSAMEKALAKSNFADSWKPQTPVYGLTDNLLNSTTAADYAEIAQIVETLKNSLLNLEDMFIAKVFSIINNIDSVHIPILLYYSSNIIKGSIDMDETKTTTINIALYSLFLSKKADLNVTVAPNVTGQSAVTLPGTVTISYYQRGRFDFHIDAKDVLPIVQNITALTGSSTCDTEAEAETISSVLNNTCNSFTIDMNGQKDYFKGTFGPRIVEDTGGYGQDIMLNRDNKSLGLFSIINLLD